MKAGRAGIEEKEERGFFKLNAVSLAFTFGGIIAVLVAIGAIVALPLILSALGLSAVTDAIDRYGRWPLLVVLTLLALAVLYRYAPSRRAPQWQWITVGSVFAAVAWLAGSTLLELTLPPACSTTSPTAAICANTSSPRATPSGRSSKP